MAEVESWDGVLKTKFVLVMEGFNVLNKIKMEMTFTLILSCFKKNLLVLKETE